MSSGLRAVAARDQTLELAHEDVGNDGLEEIEVGLDAILFLATAQDDDGQRLCPRIGAERAAHVDAVTVRQAPIQHDRVDTRRTSLVERLGTRRRFDHPEAHRVEKLRVEVAGVLVVIDDEHDGTTPGHPLHVVTRAAGDDATPTTVGAVR